MVEVVGRLGVQPTSRSGRTFGGSSPRGSSSRQRGRGSRTSMGGSRSTTGPNVEEVSVEAGLSDDMGVAVDAGMRVDTGAGRDEPPPGQPAGGNGASVATVDLVEPKSQRHRWSGWR